jgi:hypothetical protein
MGERSDLPAPLRRVVGTYRHVFPEGGWVLREVLECGHEQSIREDAYGWTDAERRRCRHCRLAVPSSRRCNGS